MATKRKEHKVLINVKDLTWGYSKTPELIFDKFNFALYENDFSIIIGKSGSGKTTFMKLLTGALKSHPKMIYHKMEDISKYSSKDLQHYRSIMGCVLQHEQLSNKDSIKDNITYPLKIQGVPQDLIDKKYTELINHFHIQTIQERATQLLSRGEQRIVALLRALIHNPEFIIADDPTSDLDYESSKKVADLLMQTNKDGNTVLLVTHDKDILDYIKGKQKVIITKL